MSLGQNDNAILKLLADEQLRKENAALAAEVERLRKAGDAMAKSLAFEYPNSPKVAAWNAAKEGGAK